MATCTAVTNGDAGIHSIRAGRSWRYFWEVSEGVTTFAVQFTIYEPNVSGTVLLRFDSDNPSPNNSLVVISDIGSQPTEPGGNDGAPAKGSVTLVADDTAPLTPGEYYEFELAVLATSGPVTMGTGRFYVEIPTFD